MATLIFKKFAGVNRSVDPAELDKRQLTGSVNFYPEKVGGDLIIRPQMTHIQYLGLELDLADKLQLVSFNDGRREIILLLIVCESNQEVNFTMYEVFTEQPPYISPVVGVTNNKNYSSDVKPSTVQWNNRLYILTGSDFYGYVVVNESAGGTPGPVGGTGLRVVTLTERWLNAESPVSPTVGTVYKGTMVLSGFVPPYGSLIRWTEVGDPDTLLGLDKSIYVGRNDAGHIVAMTEVAVEGGAVMIEPYLLVLKSTAAYMLRGLPPTSATDGDLVITPINVSEGCISKETVVKTEHGVIWCSGQSVWLVQGNGKPVEIGQAVRGHLSNLPRSPNHWHATYHDGFYKLNVPSTDATDIYTPTEQWWCDMRDFPRSISWWGPQTIKSDTAIIANINGSKLYLSAVLAGTGVHADARLETLGRDVANDLDHYAPILSPGDEASFIGELTFKEVDFDDVSTKKIIQATEIVFQHESDLTVEIFHNGDVGAGGVVDGADAIPEGFMLDTTTLDNAGSTLSLKHKTVTLKHGASRVLVNSVQPRIRFLSLGNGRMNVRFKQLVVHYSQINRRP